MDLQGILNVVFDPDADVVDGSGGLNLTSAYGTEVDPTYTGGNQGAFNSMLLNSTLRIVFLPNTPTPLV